MRAQPRVFPPLYLGLVRVGEETGALGGSLELLAGWLERDREVGQRLQAALIYPASVIVVALLARNLLTFYIAPQFFAIFAEQNTPLPAPTRLLQGVLALQSNPFVWLVAVGGLMLLYRHLRSRGLTVERRAALRAWLVRVPGLGALLAASAWARWCSAATVMARAGLSPVQTYRLAAEASGDARLLVDAENLQEALQAGQLASRYFLGHPQLYPASVAHCLAVAEDSGRMADMFGYLARSFEVEAASRVEVLGTLVEPLVLALAA